MKDTWYKKLGWFLLFSLITLVIFFIIDLIVQKIMYSINDNEYEVSFVNDEYIYDSKENNLIVLNISTTAKKYYYDIWIDDHNLNIKVENETEVTINLNDYDFVLEEGTHIIKSSFFGASSVSTYRESLITTKLVVK